MLSCIFFYRALYFYEQKGGAVMKIGVYIGKQVHELRKAAHMTQDQLADAAQVPKGNISRLERGDVEDVHVSTLLRLARALGATVNDLLRDFQDEHGL
jgi:transcriptional regulator with XRE-family HTH domain